MTFGCTIPIRGDLGTPENIRTLATCAEKWGFDHLWVGDHIIIPNQVASPHPYSPSGVYTFDRGQPWCEPLSALCYLAGLTQRIKLGTHVLVLPYRAPVLTAKILATLDYMSEGRVILGVGTGWMEEEFKALGLDTFAERGRVTNEYIRIFKELWTRDDPQYQGRYCQFSGVTFYPKPVQKPHPPIWIGGHTPTALRRAALLGDGWVPIGLRPPSQLEPEEMSSLIGQLREMTEGAGRPRDVVDIAFSTNLEFEASHAGPRRLLSGTPMEIAADIALYQQVGVLHFIFDFERDGLDRMLEDMERFARDVRPQVP